jgi:AcrR family transcriptional regulator
MSSIESRLKDGAIPTKQKIILATLLLFSKKGYSETSVRDIALSVGFTASSMYNHFPSKKDILIYMLNDYSENIHNMLSDPNTFINIKNNPTAEGLMECWNFVFDILSDDYLKTMLFVMMQEQHRNDDIRIFVDKTFNEIETYIIKIFDILKEQNVIREDMDSDYWVKIFTSITYSIPNRYMLNSSDEIANSGIDLRNILHDTFQTIFKLYGV